METDTERSNGSEQEPSQIHCAQPVFGLWRAPICQGAAREDSAEVMQGHDDEEHFTQSPKSLIHPLHAALLSAKDKIKMLAYENDFLRKENARLTVKESGTLEALEEQTSLNTQAKKENEETEARIKIMEEAFHREKTAWQEVNSKQLGEISSFKMKLLVAQSLNHEMEEEVRDSKKKIQEGRRQTEIEITFLKESLCIQREEYAALKDHWREVIREREEDAEEKWKRRVSQLERDIKEKRSLLSGLTDKMMALIGEQRDTMSLLSQSEKKWEFKCNALEERYRKDLVEKEEIWQRKVQAMERKNELEKMWLQKEDEWRHRNSALEEEIKRLIQENTQLQGLTGTTKQRMQGWRRRVMFRLRRFRLRTQRNTSTTSDMTTRL